MKSSSSSSSSFSTQDPSTSAAPPALDPRPSTLDSSSPPPAFDTRPSALDSAVPLDSTAQQFNDSTAKDHSALPTPNSPLQLPPGWIMQVDPWPEPVNAATLLDSLRSLFTQSVILPKWVPELLPLFVLHTYAYHLRDVSAYLGVESPVRRCGKTTLLSLLLRLVNRPVVASSVSSSSFFHVIQELKPTLMIDEADRFLKSRQELQGILNAGYTPDTAVVIRMTHRRAVKPSSSLAAPKRSDGPSESLPREMAALPDSSTSAAYLTGAPPQPSTFHYQPAFFSVWCPKVIAQIGHLPNTLADRCIVFRMQRKIAAEECQRIRVLNTMDLRRQCARFVLDNAQAIASARPEIPDPLNDRAADIWEPLFALADLASGDWPKLARDAAVGLAGAAEDSNPIGSLLLDIFVLFTLRKVDRMFTRDLLLGLSTQFTGRPWMEQLRNGSGLTNGKPITDLWLSRQLRPFGIKPSTLWINDQSAKGYRFEDFRDIFKRYISNTDLQVLRTEFDNRPRHNGDHKTAPEPTLSDTGSIPEPPDEPS